MPRSKKTEGTPPQKTVKQQVKKTKLYEAWNNLLIKNEKASKKNKLTDEQLYEAMAELFPDKADKTTLTRVSMVRSCYNKGTNMFAKLGAPDGDERPISTSYDADGNVLEARTRKRGPKKENTEEEDTAPSKRGRKAKAAKQDEEAEVPAPKRRGSPKKVIEKEEEESEPMTPRLRRRRKA